MVSMTGRMQGNKCKKKLTEENFYCVYAKRNNISLDDFDRPATQQRYVKICPKSRNNEKMSTFSGFINEFCSMSVDRFDGDNLNSKIFFLSHCHMDHMTGLDNPNGIGPLYLSSISSIIIKKQFPQIEDIVVLKENVSTPIQYIDANGITQFVTVTALPAYHCPGSVMFLFEQHNVKVLYTGDFRLSKRYLVKIKQFQNLIGTIDTIYIDSTFLSLNYENFPGQIRSAMTICSLIEEWLSMSSRHVISLKMPAKYGYEFLFIEIGKRLKVQIHVNESELEKYRYIPELDNIFTTNANKSKIHACFDYHNKNGKYLTCHPELNPDLIRVIKPTAMYWKKWIESSDIVKKEADEIVRVCYSNHSSMSELRDFVLYLQPKNVQLNVVPTDVIRKQQMLDALSEIMAELHQPRNCRHEAIHLSNWDNLSKLSKVNFKFSRRSKEAKEQIIGPPKRKKI